MPSTNLPEATKRPQDNGSQSTSVDNTQPVPAVKKSQALKKAGVEELLVVPRYVSVDTSTEDDAVICTTILDGNASTGRDSHASTLILDPSFKPGTHLNPPPQPNPHLAEDDTSHYRPIGIHSPGFWDDIDNLGLYSMQ
ncbi:hypothetical protein FN846DRAFT_896393 [Sphaerosporella brunnea]|uniref:Uncharacterized protein n=1 Tax=Sphaerosporella brunnea TaxID=1250544 RepID=A0A5J5ECH5_9PEZI|nr:hypothetical protein FN846DRAFT_896393 [Sphaerosporella brunnea]